MSGGIIAYDGGKAVGDEAFGMEFFVTGNFSDVFRMGYAMEDALQKLYLLLQEVCHETDVCALLERLAKFEEGHKAMLKTRFPGVSFDNPETTDVLEGGFHKQEIVDRFDFSTATLEDIIQLGMMLEIQAFDLYNRLAIKENDSESKAFFEFMSNEERQHLTFLSNEYDRLLGR